MNGYFKNETIQNCEEQIVPDEGPVPLFLLGHPTYPLMPFLLKEYPNGGCNATGMVPRQQPCRARMVNEFNECAFGFLKGRFNT